MEGVTAKCMTKDTNVSFRIRNDSWALLKLFIGRVGWVCLLTSMGLIIYIFLARCFRICDAKHVCFDISADILILEFGLLVIGLLVYCTYFFRLNLICWQRVASHFFAVSRCGCGLANWKNQFCYWPKFYFQIELVAQSKRATEAKANYPRELPVDDWRNENWFATESHASASGVRFEHVRNAHSRPHSGCVSISKIMFLLNIWARIEEDYFIFKTLL